MINYITFLPIYCVCRFNTTTFFQKLISYVNGSASSTWTCLAHVLKSSLSIDRQAQILKTWTLNPIYTKLHYNLDSTNCVAWPRIHLNDDCGLQPTHYHSLSSIRLAAGVTKFPQEIMKKCSVSHEMAVSSSSQAFWLCASYQVDPNLALYSTYLGKCHRDMAVHERKDPIFSN